MLTTNLKRKHLVRSYISPLLSLIRSFLSLCVEREKRGNQTMEGERKTCFYALLLFIQIEFLSSSLSSAAATVTIRQARWTERSTGDKKTDSIDEKKTKDEFTCLNKKNKKKKSCESRRELGASTGTKHPKLLSGAVDVDTSPQRLICTLPLVSRSVLVYGCLILIELIVHWIGEDCIGISSIKNSIDYWFPWLFVSF